MMGGSSATKNISANDLCSWVSMRDRDSDDATALMRDSNRPMPKYTQASGNHVSFLMRRRCTHTLQVGNHTQKTEHQ